MTVLSNASNVFIQPGNVVVDVGGDVWLPYAQAVTNQGSRIGIALTQAAPGSPFKVATLGRIPYDGFNIGAGAAGPVVVGSNGALSRGTGGQIIGVCDPAGTVELFRAYVQTGAPAGPMLDVLGGFSLGLNGPSANQVLVFDGVKWIPAAVPPGSLTLAGDVTGPGNANVVVSLSGVGGGGGSVTVTANTSLVGAAGTGALTFGSMTGATTLPTGNLSYAAASGKSISFAGSSASDSIQVGATTATAALLPTGITFGATAVPTFLQTQAPTTSAGASMSATAQASGPSAAINVLGGDLLLAAGSDTGGITADTAHFHSSVRLKVNASTEVFGVGQDGTGVFYEWIGQSSHANNNYYAASDGTNVYLNALSGGAVRLRVANGVAAGAYNANGLQLFSETFSQGGGVGVLGITNRGTAPTSNPVTSALLYAEAGGLKILASAATPVLTLTSALAGGAQVDAELDIAAWTGAAATVAKIKMQNSSPNLLAFNTPSGVGGDSANNLPFQFGQVSVASQNGTTTLSATQYANPIINGTGQLANTNTWTIVFPNTAGIWFLNLGAVVPASGSATVTLNSGSGTVSLTIPQAVAANTVVTVITSGSNGIRVTL